MSSHDSLHISDEQIEAWLLGHLRGELADVLVGYAEGEGKAHVAAVRRDLEMIQHVVCEREEIEGNVSSEGDTVSDMLLAQYLDNSLSPEQRAALEQTLSEDMQVRRRLIGLHRTVCAVLRDTPLNAESFETVESYPAGETVDFSDTRTYREKCKETQQKLGEASHLEDTSETRKKRLSS